MCLAKNVSTTCWCNEEVQLPFTLLHFYFINKMYVIPRLVWRYQRVNQNPYIEEEQTIQWQKEKVKKDKQRSTKHTYKAKNRVTRTPLKTRGERRCSGRVGKSCSTSDTCRWWISNLICRGLYCVQLKWEMIVCFVDIGGIDDHHCLEVIVRFVDIGGIVDQYW